MRVEVRNRNTINQQKRKAGETVAIISIADPDDTHSVIKEWADLQGILQLSFHDLDQQLNDAGFTYKLMSDSDAQQVADFVEKHQNVDLLLVQCDAGISRSPGLAAAILKHQTGDDSQIFGDRRYIPNRWVYKKTLDAMRKR